MAALKITIIVVAKTDISFQCVLKVCGKKYFAVRPDFPHLLQGILCGPHVEGSVFPLQFGTPIQI